MRLIDADALDFKFDRRCFSEEDENYIRGVDEAIGVVKNAPTINPDDLVKHGEWEKVRKENIWGDFVPVPGSGLAGDLGKSCLAGSGRKRRSVFSGRRDQCDGSDALSLLWDASGRHWDGLDGDSQRQRAICLRSSNPGGHCDCSAF